MNPKSKLQIVLATMLSTLLFFASCKKDKNEDPVQYANLSIEMSHLAGSEQLYFDSTYTTANGDLVTPTLFKYYLSNIRLIRTDDTEYSIPDSYFLVNHDVPSSLSLHLKGLSSGDFKSIRFLVGVDSAHNVSGSQDGALDPVNGMFWDWNTGYIFFKLEGTSPSVPGTDDFFEYHIGGFEGANKNYREVALDFNGDILHLAPGKTPELHFVVDMLEVFKNPTTINLATFPASVTILGPEATIIADNYSDMFTYDHMHQD